MLLRLRGSRLIDLMTFKSFLVDAQSFLLGMYLLVFVGWFSISDWLVGLLPGLFELSLLFYAKQGKKLCDQLFSCMFSCFDLVEVVFVSMVIDQLDMLCPALLHRC